nr:MAG TPA: hypothetical protein [Caudoviricetes sp.]
MLPAPGGPHSPPDDGTVIQTFTVYHPPAGGVKRPCYFCTQISKGG